MKLFFVVIYYSLFKSKDTIAKLTSKRIKVLLVLVPSYIAIEAFCWLGMLIDEIFFRGYKKIQVKNPVFVVGAPRSGTSFMQRILSKNKAEFTSLRPWEMLLAPSIAQKKFWHAMAAVDGIFKGRVGRYLKALDERIYTKSQLAVMHKFSWFEVEEDDPILQTYTVILPPTRTKVWVPEGFLEPDTEYKLEVIAQEESGNRTITEEGSFTTDD